MTLEEIAERVTENEEIKKALKSCRPKSNEDKEDITLRVKVAR